MSLPMRSHRPSPRRVALSGLAIGCVLALLPLQADPAHADEDSAAPTAAEALAAKQAASDGRPVVVKGTTSQRSQTVANPDGTFTLTASRGPVRVRDGEGWTPIDTTLAAGAGGRLVPRATAVAMSFSPGGQGPLATIADGDKQLSLQFPMDLPAPRTDAGTLTYPDVLDGVDLAVRVTGEAFSETLIVHDPQAAANPALRSLDLMVTTRNLEYTVADDGSASATDADGQPVFASPAPSTWDDSSMGSGDAVSGDQQQPIPVTARSGPTARTSHAAASTTVRLAPPEAALIGPDITYPVYIDPAFSAARASFLVTRSGQSSYANNTDYLRVGYCAWDGCSPYYRARSYLSFNIAALKPRSGHKAQIKSAGVYLTQVHSAASASTTVSLHKATAFTATTAWPGTAGALLQTVTASGTAQIKFTASAVASYVQQATNSGAASIAFGLKAPNENDANQWKKFANNPTLAITYVYPPGVPTIMAPANTLTCAQTTYVRTSRPTLRAQATDYNNDGGQIAIYHQVVNAAGAAVANGRTVGASGATQALTLADPLPDGRYTDKAYAAQTREGATRNSAYGTPVTFTVDTTAPAAPAVTSFTHPQNQPGIGAVYGETATTSSFALAVPADTRIAGYAYSWVSSTVPVPSGATCLTAQSIGSQSGYVKAANGVAGLNLPAGIESADHTLTVRAIDEAGNLSPATGYDFYITPGTGTVTTTEAETSTVAAHSADYGIEASTARSGGKQLIVSPTEEGQSITLNIDVPTDGTWIIQPAMAASRNYGILGFWIDGHQLTTTVTGDDWDETTEEPITIDLYSSTNHPLSYPLPAGHLTAGTHTLTFTVTGRNPESTTWYNKYLTPPRDDDAMSFAIDYIRAVKIGD
ncbi:hypothetical protein [Acidipropionibacterium acidipropionici]|uniref:hypothetical protein n=1 Tax=Acidipropionibacterium acidipropionici TaxID=1748 RepID=UPI000F7F87FE|nr:hypothetical protein [Acidipropionibacterium acidipropionici]QCV96300.1 hypothetical protein FEZ30_14470 [Acidipropionibacterium acidipropionici]